MLKEISDPKKISRLETVATEIIEDTYLIRMDWINKKNRVAVVVESAMHLNEEYARNFAAAIVTAGHVLCCAVATEELAGEVRYWEIPATPEVLLEFSKATAMYNFALIPEDGSFVILCTVDDYIIVAGDSKFVEKAVGGDIAAARAGFRKFIFDERHAEIADKYE